MGTATIQDSTVDRVLFERAADGRAGFVECGPATATLGELCRSAEAFARWLIDGGIQPGDKVSLWLPNGIPWIVAYVASAAAGAVSVPISTRLSLREAEFIVGHSESKVLVAADRFLDRDYASEARELAARRSPQDGLPTVVVVDPIRGQLPAGPATTSLPGSKPDDPAIVQYTSGTTGVPKGCLLSHRTWTNNARISAELAGLRSDGTILCPSPFFHLFGSLTGLMGAISVGASFMTFPTFKSAECTAAIRSRRVTHFVGVPTMWLDLMKSAEPGTLPSLRSGVWGGAGFPRAALERAMDGSLYGWNLQAIYGMTEAPTLTQIRPDDPLAQKLNSVGRSTLGVEVQTVDPATGKNVGPGEIGEIWGRGYNRMIGYFKDGPASEARFSGDWIRSGDLGTLDTNGFLVVVGRLTDMIVTGGANVYAREVESVILELKGTRLAAMVGREDRRLGEVPVAWVEVDDRVALDEASIMAHCRSNLAEYKVPRHVYIVRQIPLTASGKVHKALLRKLANERVG